MNKKRTLLASLLTGIVLAGFPLIAIARHSYVQDQDIHFKVNSTISPRSDVENFDIWSEINMLDLAKLTGRNSFLRGQTVFVHMSSGPNGIAYPFAVTSSRPEATDESVFTIRGKVTGRDQNTLIVRYNFETFLPSKPIQKIVRSDPSREANAVLAINDKGIARLVGVEIDGRSYPYRKIDFPALDGLTQ